MGERIDKQCLLCGDKVKLTSDPLSSYVCCESCEEIYEWENLEDLDEPKIEVTPTDGKATEIFYYEGEVLVVETNKDVLVRKPK